MPVQVLNTTDFLALSLKGQILDVRSPREFSQGHIPGAASFPLFTDEERKVVGTLYKHQGRETAIEKGLELVGPKLANFVKHAREFNKPLFVHCWRGGMRSGSMAWLLSTAGMDVYTLKGGYKAYRKHVLGELSKHYKLIVLGGRTGSGKTDVLLELKKNGEQVIDLEGMAHHKGSSFGSIHQPPQPTTEHFGNLLCEQLSLLDTSKYIWIEDESRMIGTVNIDEAFFNTLRKAPLVVLQVTDEYRLTRLATDYGTAERKLLDQAFERIKKKLGGQHLNAAMEALNNGDLKLAAAVALRYYDKAYDFGLSTKEAEVLWYFEPKVETIQAIGQELREFVQLHLDKWKKSG
ncbi:MAG: tRNA 2-selenouridine(34) synthase MnmH [Bacteroidia bacterium]|nr:tRNA 2-selenouridine(34) synthase MnmH [Bacteroidia bacterium]MBP7260565.1 tRNA 2-selenouridine(34) synthase MnmH [Bacteroidia bacterium]MBP9180841.1 tRNA 2-selenouridine(34) synthase MnmH [Bacteroidia bacterium]MBP9725591.1 tRNA 2-selenouridine(34) synthase MnmH [Bacteroidia bacterium]